MRKLRLEFCLVVAVLLLAAFTRGFRIGEPPLRGDEGFSFRFASLPINTMLAAFAISEPNPPLQFFFIKAWVAIAGPSEVALRWPSALVGVMGVAVLFAFTRALAGPTAALFAAVLLALQPFLVWYGQDMRVYSALATVLLTGGWATWLAAEYNRKRYWFAAGFLWWLGLMLHYFAAVSLGLIGLAVLLTARTRWRPLFITASLAALAYLPWALYIFPLLSGHTKSWLTFIPPLEALTRTLVAYSVGGQLAGATQLIQTLGVIFFTVSFLMGVSAALRQNRPAFIWLCALGPAVPLGLYLISIWRPVFIEHYAVGGLSGSVALAALGIATIPQWPRFSRTLLLLSLCVLSALALRNYYFEPAFSKAPDWRALAQHLKLTARPNEIVLVNLPDPAFEYYFTGSMPVENTPSGGLAEVGEAATVAQLTRLRDSYTHLRFLFSPSPGYDPKGFVGQWLNACCELTDEHFVANFRVQSFDTPQASLAAQQTLHVEFEHGLVFTGFRVVNPQLRAGETLRLTLFWSATQPITQSYTVFTHFLAPDGFYLTGADGLPRNATRPTFSWQAGETIIDPRPIAIPKDLTPGDYFLEIGLYEAESGQRLITAQANGTSPNAIRLPVTIQIQAP